MNKSEKIIEILKNLHVKIKPVLGTDLNSQNIFIIDFTENNKELMNIDLNDTEIFGNYIFSEMDKRNSTIAIGRYNEDRAIYKRSELFKDQTESRTIHLGIDLWTKENIPVFAPLDGKVHSFKNNNSFGNYGPTIVLEHNIENIIFYTLYGHLSTDSLDKLYHGKKFIAGSEIARIGNYPENGNWPPHLHFQIITDMMDKKGDFYGVASLSDREKLTKICPDPNYILQIQILQN